MRISTPSLAAALLFAAASPAFAQDADTAPPPAFTVSGGAALVTDYRFRGISQTDKDFAVQGTFTVSHESGLYATVWGSSIDEYVAGGSDQEIDLIAGYKHTFGGTTLDVGVLYYYYPGSSQFIDNYASDFVEPYASLSHTIGPVTGKLSAAYAPKAKALSVGNGKEDNLYTALDLSAGVPNTPVSLSAHIGHSFGPSYLTIGKEYTDWSLGASYTWNHLTFGVSYVDTDKALYSALSGKNISKGGVVGSVGVSF